MAGNETDSPARTITRSPEVVEAEAEIERTRERVSQSVLALRHAVAKKTDWREWVRRHPAVFMAAAFTLGTIFGYRSLGYRSDRRSARGTGERRVKRGGTWTWK